MRSGSVTDGKLDGFEVGVHLGVHGYLGVHTREGGKGKEGRRQGQLELGGYRKGNAEAVEEALEEENLATGEVRGWWAGDGRA